MKLWQWNQLEFIGYQCSKFWKAGDLKVTHFQNSPCCQSSGRQLSAWQHKHFVVAIQPGVDFTDGCSPVWAHQKRLLLRLTKSARIFYRLWTSGTAYADPGVDAYEQKYHERMVHNLKKKAHALGFDERCSTYNQRRAVRFVRCR